MTTSISEQTGLVHPALFYADARDYLQALVPFVTAGLEHGDRVAAAVPPANLVLLRDALGDAAAEVTMIDMADAGGNPGCILPAVLHAVADPHPDEHVRIIGEPIWAERSGAEYPACVQHEVLINSAFLGRDVTIVCPYNTTTLGPDVLRDAHRTHPLLWADGAQRHSPDYDPDAMWATYNQPLADGSNAMIRDPTTAADLPALRRAATEHALRLGLAPQRVHDLRYILTELVTNSLIHSRGGCQLRLSRRNGHIICAVSDDGQLTDALAGRRRPPDTQPGGRGLLMVNHLADLVRTHTTANRTTIHAYLPTSPDPAARRAGSGQVWAGSW